jgi:hypothetical protein
MTIDHIRYDILTQDALRNVVRTVLTDAAQKGLPGEHHFYISFNPKADGVKLSQRMRDQYPDEMTIVLQYQFWDLVVTDDRFEVGLSFGGIAERVVVPFAAIKSFVDPSVQFGVQFEQIADGQAAGTGAARPPAEHKQASAVPAPAPAAVPTPANRSAEPDKDPPATGGEVVRLDRFRKK